MLAELPQGLTRGYSTAFRTMIAETRATALTLADLDSLDTEDTK